MQEQIDSLELNLAIECKEALAGLQTEITEIGCELQSAGIPFLDYRTYCIKTLVDPDPVSDKFNDPQHVKIRLTHTERQEPQPRLQGARRVRHDRRETVLQHLSLIHI